VVLVGRSGVEHGDVHDRARWRDHRPQGHRAGHALPAGERRIVRRHLVEELRIGDAALRGPDPARGTRAAGCVLGRGPHRGVGDGRQERHQQDERAKAGWNRSAVPAVDGTGASPRAGRRQMMPPPRGMVAILASLGRASAPRIAPEGRLARSANVRVAGRGDPSIREEVLHRRHHADLLVLGETGRGPRSGSSPAGRCGWRRRGCRSPGRTARRRGGRRASPRRSSRA